MQPIDAQEKPCSMSTISASDKIKSLCPEETSVEAGIPEEIKEPSN